MPSLIKLISICGENCVYLSKEALLCSHELDNEWLWETSFLAVAWSSERAVNLICIWLPVCWAWRDWRILSYHDPMVCLASQLTWYLFPRNHCVRATRVKATGVVVEEEEAVMKSSLLVCVSLQDCAAALFWIRKAWRSSGCGRIQHAWWSYLSATLQRSPPDSWVLLSQVPRYPQGCDQSPSCPESHRHWEGCQKPLLNGGELWEGLAAGKLCILLSFLCCASRRNHNDSFCSTHVEGS